MLRLPFLCLSLLFAGICVAGNTPVFITATNAAQRAALARMRLDIDSVHGTRVRAYVSETEHEALVKAGFAVAADLALVNRLDGIRTAGFAAAGYPTYAQYTNMLSSYARTYTNLCRLVSLGKSVQNRDVWLLRISDNPGNEEDEPEFRYVSSLHGDEVVGMQNCLKLIDLLLTNYTTDANLTHLVNEIDWSIVPLANPDGYVLVQRNNADNVNLNRDFPDRAVDSNNTTTAREPETAALMRNGMTNSFVLSANFHGGVLVVNYPYDGRSDGAYGYFDYVSCPDDALFVALARSYADANPRMRLSNGDPAFTNGICNGAQWYEIYGGLQDWSYVWPACFDTTIELDSEKWPNASRLPALWAENMTSMLKYAEWCLKGVRGIVTDTWSGAPLSATIAVSGLWRTVSTDGAAGDYHRILLPGTYGLSASAEGYYPKTLAGIVVTNGPATRVDIGLEPVPEPAALLFFFACGGLVWVARRK